MKDQPLQRLLTRFPGMRILVVGDVMLDEYVWDYFIAWQNDNTLQKIVVDRSLETDPQFSTPCSVSAIS